MEQLCPLHPCLKMSNFGQSSMFLSGILPPKLYRSAKLLRRLHAGRCGQSVDLMFPDCWEWEFYERQLEDETPLGRVGSWTGCRQPLERTTRAAAGGMFPLR